MSNRARYRDYYDFVMITKKLKVEIDEVINLVKQKRNQKNYQQKNILNNWKIAKFDKQENLQNIYCTEEIELGKGR